MLGVWPLYSKTSSVSQYSFCFVLSTHIWKEESIRSSLVCLLHVGFVKTFATGEHEVVFTWKIAFVLENYFTLKMQRFYFIVCRKSTVIEHGQLGQGHTSNIGNAVDQMGNNLSVIDWGSGFEVEDIVCGKWHTCALSTNGSVRCCGHGMISPVRPFCPFIG